MATRVTKSRRVHARGLRGRIIKAGGSPAYAGIDSAHAPRPWESVKSPLDSEDRELLGDVGYTVTNGRVMCRQCRYWYPEEWKGCRRCKS